MSIPKSDIDIHPISIPLTHEQVEEIVVKDLIYSAELSATHIREIKTKIRNGNHIPKHLMQEYIDYEKIFESMLVVLSYYMSHSIFLNEKKRLVNMAYNHG